MLNDLSDEETTQLVMTRVHFVITLPSGVCVSGEETEERGKQGVQLRHGTSPAATGQEGRSRHCERNRSGHSEHTAQRLV